MEAQRHAWVCALTPRLENDTGTFSPAQPVAASYSCYRKLMQHVLRFMTETLRVSVQRERGRAEAVGERPPSGNENQDGGRVATKQEPRVHLPMWSLPIHKDVPSQLL